jgi:hypothetical protein
MGMMTRSRVSSTIAAMIMLLTFAAAGSPAASRHVNAQDSGGKLTFNTPTPTDGEQTDSNQQNDTADEVSFGADAWHGGFLRNDSAYYGRPWTSIYGAQSDYPAASLTITLADDPEKPVVLTFDGLDDEAPGNNEIVVLVNKQEVFRGQSWFPSWDGVGNGENADWTAVRITIPPDILIAGNNVVTIRNLTDGANFSSPPYVLLSVGTIASSEPGIFAKPDGLEVEVETLDFSIGSG